MQIMRKELLIYTNIFTEKRDFNVWFFKDGSRWGSIDSSGSIYASDGTYLGSLDKFGKFHDSSGTYMGSIDSQGKYEIIKVII